MNDKERGVKNGLRYILGVSKSNHKIEIMKEDNIKKPTYIVKLTNYQDKYRDH
jgi:hypothetical protein